MKKFMILLVLSLLLTSLFAARINENTALNIAETHLRALGQLDFSIDGTYQVMSDNEAVVAYVHHLSPQGFIIISTDTDVAPVVGYSFRNEFDITDTEKNIGFLWVKQDMTSRLEAIPFTSNEVISQNNNLWNSYLAGSIDLTSSRDTVYPPEGLTAYEGWVETQWNQSPSPYNTFCPMDPSTNQRCIVGCVATAMAQIMNYHRYIGSPVFSNSDDYYSTTTYPYIHIDDDAATLSFPTFPELNSYLSDMTVAYALGYTITNDMVAAMNFAAGVSVEMGYSSDGSGAYSSDVAPAMVNKFGYDTSQYVGYINATFYNNLQTDMMEARPVYLGILANGSSGHAIIADGWNETTGLYHLNMGWGGSQNGWYSLPQGMPSGYNQISSAVINIEGGTVPFALNGQVFATGAPLDETTLTLVGPRYYEFDITDPNGYFDTDYMHAGTYEATAIIELADGGYFYKTETVTIDENNNTLVIFLDNFEHLSGTITAPVSAENAHVNVYQDDVLITSGVADVNGVYEIPGVLPGEYQAVASLNGNYFQEQIYAVSAATQAIHFTLEEHQYNHVFHFAGEPTDKFQFLADMSCAIRLAGEDIADFAGDAVAKLSFIPAFDPADGEIYAQLWKGSLLVSEKQVTDFVDGEWKNVTLDDFAIIDTETEYFVGYRIHSLVGPIPVAWHDAGPNLEGKGAYVRTTGWIPIPGAFDFNLCIKGTIVSQMPTSSDNNTVNTLSNSLGNNYPNPFNPTTNISYNITSDSKVDLNVYNMKGQLVKTLVSSNQTAGVHTVTWNGKDNTGRQVGSGLYFYKMNAGKYSSTKKMIMLK
jgi:Peptidase C10 family/FlgD Ig-like domain/Spi protease inhibitor